MGILCKYYKFTICIIVSIALVVGLFPNSAIAYAADNLPSPQEETTESQDQGDDTKETGAEEEGKDEETEETTKEQNPRPLDNTKNQEQTQSQQDFQAEAPGIQSSQETDGNFIMSPLFSVVDGLSFYHVNNLKDFQFCVNDNLNIILDQDIELDSNYCSPDYYEGILDGNDKSITANFNSDYGLFKYLKNSTIKKLNLTMHVFNVWGNSTTNKLISKIPGFDVSGDNKDIDSDHLFSGILADCAEGEITVDNVTINGSVNIVNNDVVENILAPWELLHPFESTAYSVGGAFGFVKDNSNVSFSNTVITADVENNSMLERNAGGYIGKSSNSNIEVKESLFLGKIQSIGAWSVLSRALDEAVKFVFPKIVDGCAVKANAVLDKYKAIFKLPPKVSDAISTEQKRLLKNKIDRMNIDMRQYGSEHTIRNNNYINDNYKLSRDYLYFSEEFVGSFRGTDKLEHIINANNNVFGDNNIDTSNLSNKIKADINLSNILFKSMNDSRVEGLAVLGDYNQYVYAYWFQKNPLGDVSGIDGYILKANDLFSFIDTYKKLSLNGDISGFDTLLRANKPFLDWYLSESILKDPKTIKGASSSILKNDGRLNSFVTAHDNYGYSCYRIKEVSATTQIDANHFWNSQILLYKYDPNNLSFGDTAYSFTRLQLMSELMNPTSQFSDSGSFKEFLDSHKELYHNILDNGNKEFLADLFTKSTVEVKDIDLNLNDEGFSHQWRNNYGFLGDDDEIVQLTFKPSGNKSDAGIMLYCNKSKVKNMLHNLEKYFTWSQFEHSTCLKPVIKQLFKTVYPDGNYEEKFKGFFQEKLFCMPDYLDLFNKIDDTYKNDSEYWKNLDWESSEELTEVVLNKKGSEAYKILNDKRVDKVTFLSTTRYGEKYLLFTSSEYLLPNPYFISAKVFFDSLIDFSIVDEKITNVLESYNNNKLNEMRTEFYNNHIIKDPNLLNAYVSCSAPKYLRNKSENTDATYRWYDADKSLRIAGIDGFLKAIPENYENKKLGIATCKDSSRDKYYVWALDKNNKIILADLDLHRADFDNLFVFEDNKIKNLFTINDSVLQSDFVELLIKAFSKDNIQGKALIYLIKTQFTNKYIPVGKLDESYVTSIENFINQIRSKNNNNWYVRKFKNADRIEEVDKIINIIKSFFEGEKEKDDGPNHEGGHEKQDGNDGNQGGGNQGGGNQGRGNQGGGNQGGGNQDNYAKDYYNDNEQTGKEHKGIIGEKDPNSGDKSYQDHEDVNSSNGKVNITGEEMVHYFSEDKKIKIDSKIKTITILENDTNKEIISFRTDHFLNTINEIDDESINSDPANNLSYIMCLQYLAKMQSEESTTVSFSQIQVRDKNASFDKENIYINIEFDNQIKNYLGIENGYKLQNKKIKISKANFDDYFTTINTVNLEGSYYKDWLLPFEQLYFSAPKKVNIKGFVLPKSSNDYLEILVSIKQDDNEVTIPFRLRKDYYETSKFKMTDMMMLTKCGPYWQNDTMGVSDFTINNKILNDVLGESDTSIRVSSILEIEHDSWLAPLWTDYNNFLNCYNGSKCRANVPLSNKENFYKYTRIDFTLKDEKGTFLSSKKISILLKLAEEFKCDENSDAYKNLKKFRNVLLVNELFSKKLILQGGNGTITCGVTGDIKVKNVDNDGVTFEFLSSTIKTKYSAYFTWEDLHSLDKDLNLFQYLDEYDLKPFASKDGIHVYMSEKNASNNAAGDSSNVNSFVFDNMEAYYKFLSKTYAYSQLIEICDENKVYIDKSDENPDEYLFYKYVDNIRELKLSANVDEVIQYLRCASTDKDLYFKFLSTINRRSWYLFAKIVNKLSASDNDYNITWDTVNFLNQIKYRSISNDCEIHVFSFDKNSNYVYLCSNDQNNLFIYKVKKNIFTDINNDNQELMQALNDLFAQDRNCLILAKILKALSKEGFLNIEKTLMNWPPPWKNSFFRPELVKAISDSFDDFSDIKIDESNDSYINFYKNNNKEPAYKILVDTMIDELVYVDKIKDIYGEQVFLNYIFIMDKVFADFRFLNFRKFGRRGNIKSIMDFGCSSSSPNNKFFDTVDISINLNSFLTVFTNSSRINSGDFGCWKLQTEDNVQFLKYSFSYDNSKVNQTFFKNNKSQGSMIFGYYLPMYYLQKASSYKNLDFSFTQLPSKVDDNLIFEITENSDSIHPISANFVFNKSLSDNIGKSKSFDSDSISRMFEGDDNGNGTITINGTALKEINSNIKYANFILDLPAMFNCAFLDYNSVLEKISENSFFVKAEIDINAIPSSWKYSKFEVYSDREDSKSSVVCQSAVSLYESIYEKSSLDTNNEFFKSAKKFLTTSRIWEIFGLEVPRYIIDLTDTDKIRLSVNGDISIQYIDEDKVSFKFNSSTDEQSQFTKNFYWSEIKATIKEYNGSYDFKVNSVDQIKNLLNPNIINSNEVCFSYQGNTFKCNNIDDFTLFINKCFTDGKEVFQKESINKILSDNVIKDHNEEEEIINTNGSLHQNLNLNKLNEYSDTPLLNSVINHAGSLAFCPSLPIAKDNWSSLTKTVSKTNSFVDARTAKDIVDNSDTFGNGSTYGGNTQDEDTLLWELFAGLLGGWSTTQQGNIQPDSVYVDNGMEQEQEQDGVSQFGLDYFQIFGSSLSEAVKSIPTGLGGSTQVHYDAYAGGIIGVCDGGSIIVSQSAVSSEQISGGKYSGGIIGKAVNTNVAKVSDSRVAASVYTSDYSIEGIVLHPATGGIVGYLDNTFLECKNTISVTCSVSRGYSGGYVGNANSGRCDFVNCGSVGGVAGKLNAGGYCGIADNSTFFSFTNCYSACEYDKVSFENIYASDWIGLEDIITKNNSNRIDGLNDSSLAGSYFGNYTSQVSFSNSYAKVGLNTFGNSTIKDNPVKSFTKDEAYNGRLTYLLNQNNTYPANEIIFGQNLEFGERQFIPIPNHQIGVYEGRNLEQEPIYSNYNTDKNQVVFLDLYGDKCSIDCPVSRLTSLYDGSIQFNFKPNNGYGNPVISFTAESEKYNLSNVSQDLLDYQIHLNEDGLTYTCSIKNIKNSGSVKVFCSEMVNMFRPEGDGTEEFPYLIDSKEKLSWLSQNFSTGYSFGEIYIDICCDIEYTGYEWNPIFTYDDFRGFNGRIRGFNHTIKFCSVLDKYGNVPSSFIDGIAGGTIEDLTIEANFSCAIFAKYIIDRYDGQKIENPEEFNSVKYTRDFNGDNSIINNHFHPAYLKNCHAKGNVVGSERFMGGFVSIASGFVSIENCINDAFISQSANSDDPAAGGIVGKIYNNNYSTIKEGKDVIAKTSNVIINNSKNNASISATNNAEHDNHAGGIVGIASTEDISTYLSMITRFFQSALFASFFALIKTGISFWNFYQYLIEGSLMASMSNPVTIAILAEVFVTIVVVEALTDVASGPVLSSYHVEINNCENYGSIYDSRTNSNNLTCGGLVGMLYRPMDEMHGTLKDDNPLAFFYSSSCYINKSVNYGNMGYDDNNLKSVVQTSGGIVGWCNDSSVKLELDYTLNKANIYAYGDESGGFIGCFDNGCNHVHINNSAQIGDVKGEDNTGLILGSTGDLTSFSAINRFNRWGLTKEIKVAFGYAWDFIVSKTPWAHVLPSGFICRNVYVYNPYNKKITDTWAATDRESYANSVNIFYVDYSQITNGELTYLLNGHPDETPDKDNLTIDKYNKDIFGQDLNILNVKDLNKREQFFSQSPCFIADEDQRKETTVYWNKKLQNYANYFDIAQLDNINVQFEFFSDFHKSIINRISLLEHLKNKLAIAKNSSVDEHEDILTNLRNDHDLKIFDDDHVLDNSHLTLANACMLLDKVIDKYIDLYNNFKNYVFSNDEDKEAIYSKIDNLVEADCDNYKDLYDAYSKEFKTDLNNHKLDYFPIIEKIDTKNVSDVISYKISTGIKYYVTRIEKIDETTTKNSQETTDGAKEEGDETASEKSKKSLLLYEIDDDTSSNANKCGDIYISLDNISDLQKIKIYCSEYDNLEYDSDEQAYIIKNENDLAMFASKVNYGETSINAKVVNNISVDNQMWRGIGTKNNPFQGKFYGAKGDYGQDITTPTIKLYDNSTLFNYVKWSSNDEDEANIYDFNLIYDSHSTVGKASLIDVAQGCNINNVVVGSREDLIVSESSAGFIINASGSLCTIKDCNNNLPLLYFCDEKTEKNQNIVLAGFVAFCDCDKLIIKNSNNNGVISLQNNYDEVKFNDWDLNPYLVDDPVFTHHSAAAGCIGIAYGNSELNISNFTNNSDIISHYNSAGIIGEYSMKDDSSENCSHINLLTEIVNNGNIISEHISSGMVSKIIRNNANFEFYHCINNGALLSSYFAAGIVCFFVHSALLDVCSCEQNSSISSTNIGGILGRSLNRFSAIKYENDDIVIRIKLEDCIVNADLFTALNLKEVYDNTHYSSETFNSYIGGLIAYAKPTLRKYMRIDNCLVVVHDFIVSKSESFRIAIGLGYADFYAFESANWNNEEMDVRNEINKYTKDKYWYYSECIDIIDKNGSCQNRTKTSTQSGEFVDYQELWSGKFTYNHNQNLRDSTRDKNAKHDRLWFQAIDKVESNRQNCPHVKSDVVYYYKEGDFCSNYDNLICQNINSIYNEFIQQNSDYENLENFKYGDDALSNYLDFLIKNPDMTNNNLKEKLSDNTKRPLIIYSAEGPECSSDVLTTSESDINNVLNLSINLNPYNDRQYNNIVINGYKLREDFYKSKDKLDIKFKDIVKEIAVNFFYKDEKSINEDHLKWVAYNLLKDGAVKISYRYDYYKMPFLNEENNYFEISTLNELLWLSDYVRSGNTKHTHNAILTNDIDFETHEWEELGTQNHPYKGIFDGCNYQILNLHGNKSGFVKYGSNATIRNLKLQVEINASTIGCVILNSDSCIVHDVEVYGNVTSPKLVFYGGVVGRAYGNQKHNLTDEDSSSELKQNFGEELKGTIIYNCTSNVKLSHFLCATYYDVANDKELQTYAVKKDMEYSSDTALISIYYCLIFGGMLAELGINKSNSDNNAVIFNCKNHTDAVPYCDSLSYINVINGGLVGFVDNVKPNLNIKNSFNHGSLNGDICGGVVGYSSKIDSYNGASGGTVNIESCEVKNHAKNQESLNIMSNNYCGGIFGAIDNADSGSAGYSLNVNKCFIDANMSSKDCAGGVLGYCDEATSIKISNCGIVGYLSISNDIESVVNACGGILGFIDLLGKDNTSYIKNCFCLADIKAPSKYFGHTGSALGFYDAYSWHNKFSIGRCYAKTGCCSSGKIWGEDSAAITDLGKTKQLHNGWVSNTQIKEGVLCYRLNNETSNNKNVFKQSLISPSWPDDLNKEEDLYPIISDNEDSIVYWHRDANNNSYYDNHNDISICKEIPDTEKAVQAEEIHTGFIKSNINDGSIQCMSKSGDNTQRFISMLGNKEFVSGQWINVVVSSNVGCYLTDLTVKSDNYQVVYKYNGGLVIDTISLLEDGKWVKYSINQNATNVEEFNDKLDKLKNLFIYKDDGTFTVFINEGKTINIDAKTANVVKPSGSGTIEKPYLISSYAELLWLSKNVNSNLEGEFNAKLVNDILCTNYNGENWVPIGTELFKYKWVFDGNGKHIKNLTIDNQEKDKVGLFGFVSNATIKNLFIEDAFYNVGGHVGGVAYSVESNTNIKNVSFSGKITSSATLMGGIVAEVTGFNNCFYQCCNYGILSSGKNSDSVVGGIVGHASYSASMNLIFCENYCNVFSNESGGVNIDSTGTSVYGDDAAGGILGMIDDEGSNVGAKDCCINIVNCNNYGKIAGEFAGGIFGRYYSGHQNIEINHSNNFGFVNGSFCGGLFGSYYDSVKNSKLDIYYCSNFAPIGMPGIAELDAGGLFGYMDSNSTTLNLNNSANYGTVYNTYSVNQTDVALSMIIMIPMQLWFNSGINDATEIIGDITSLWGFGPMGGLVHSIKTSDIGVKLGFAAASWVFQLIYDVIDLGMLAYTFAKMIRTGRLFYEQYAGGICGHLDSCNDSNSKINNVINYAAVYGNDSESDQFCGGFDVSNKIINNTYVISNSNATNNNVNYVSYTKFESGEVGYKIEQSLTTESYFYNWFSELKNALDGNDNNLFNNEEIESLEKNYSTTYRWGQVIDDYNFGPRMSSPILYSSKISSSEAKDYDWPVVYKIHSKNPDSSDDGKSSSNQDVIYSNINLKGLGISYEDLNNYTHVNFEYIQNKLDANSKDDFKLTTDQDLNTYYDISVVDSTVNRPVSAQKENYENNKLKFNLNYHANSSFVIKPSKSINDNYIEDISLDAYCDNDYYVEELKNPDSSVTKQWWSNYGQVPSSNDNKEKDVKTKDNYNKQIGQVTFYSDGTIHGWVKTDDSGNNKELFRNIYIKVGNNPLTLFKKDYDNKIQVCKPWTGSSSLPDNGGAYYLANDVALDCDYKPNVSTMIYLNGYNINLSNDSSIIAKKDVLLEICDTSCHKNKFFYFDGENNHFTLINRSDQTSDYWTSSGIISKDLSSSNKPIFKVEQGFIGLDGFAVLQNPDSQILSIDFADVNKKEGKSYLNCIIYRHYIENNDDGLKSINIIPQEYQNFDFSENSQDERYKDFLKTFYNSLNIGKSFSFKDIDLQGAPKNNYIDFFFDIKNGEEQSTYNSNLIFDDLLSSDYVYSFFCNKEADVVLLDNIESFKTNYKLNEHFTSFNTDDATITFNLDSSLEKDNFKLLLSSKKHTHTINGMQVNVFEDNKVTPIDNFNNNAVVSDTVINPMIDKKHSDLCFTEDSDVVFVFETNRPNSILQTASLVPLENTDTVIMPENINDIQYKANGLINFDSAKLLNYKNYVLRLTFCDSEELFKNPNYIKEVRSASDLQAINHNKFMMFVLVDDIIADNTWNIPNGVYKLDLNGHNLIAGFGMDNVIRLTDKDSSLTIIDSSIDVAKNASSTNLRHTYFVKNDDCCYSKTDKETQYYLSGGYIGGIHCDQTTTKKLYDRIGSAIYVEKGKLYMLSGNIAENTCNGILGGAALTVSKDAQAHLGSDVNIAFNHSTGDKEFYDMLFSAGILNSGNVDSRASIHNNVAYHNASSAVYCKSGTFKNYGSILNNNCIKNIIICNNCGHKYSIIDRDSFACSKCNTLNDSNSFSTETSLGTVYISGEISNEEYKPASFINFASIKNNYSDHEIAAICNYGHFAIYGSSDISDNNCMIGFNRFKTFDVYHSSIAQSIDVDYDHIMFVEYTNIKPTSIFTETDAPFIRNWSFRINTLSIDRIFTAVQPESFNKKKKSKHNEYKVVLEGTEVKITLM